MWAVQQIDRVIVLRRITARTKPRSYRIVVDYKTSAHLYL